MSNFLAIATVTATLRKELQIAIDADVPGAKVTTVRPDGLSHGTGPPGVNLFLYQATPNPGWRNADLPTRNGDGRLAQRPRAALDLHYVLTFFGSEEQLEPQRLLGAVTRRLHEMPVVTRAMIANTLSDDTFNFLEKSDLANEAELVRLTPTSLSLEELSKLWSVFFQTPYALSSTYQGTVVFIDAETSPRPPLPVRERGIFGRSFRQPVIDSIQSSAGPRAPIVAGDTVILSGKQLGGQAVQVRIGGALVAPETAGDDRVTLPLTSPPLPAEALRAGVQAIQLVQPTLLGRPLREHVGVESNAAPFVLRPKLNAVQATASAVTLTLEPPVGPRQRVVLLLNERRDEEPLAYSFIAAPRDDVAGSIEVAIANVKPAHYWVRAQVDGAESVLDLDPTSPGVGPEVVIP